MAVADQSFGKSARLLNARDYKAVFDAAEIKASNQHILLLAKPNSLSHSRLGLVIAKKNVRLAVQRNRIKRIVRETFRIQQAQPSIDIVVLARHGLDRLESPELQARFGKLLKELNGKARRKLTNPD